MGECSLAFFYGPSRLFTSRMSSSVWISLIPGFAIGGAYVLVALISVRLLAGREGVAFAAGFVGGMMIRMMLVLGLTALVLVVAPPASPIAFASAVAGCVLVGLTVEIVYTLRLLRQAA